MTDPTLFKPPAQTGALTDLQTRVLTELKHRPLTAWDAHRTVKPACRHCASGLCLYGEQEGSRLLKALRKRQLARYSRRDKRWHATSGYPQPGSQTDQIPY